MWLCSNLFEQPFYPCFAEYFSSWCAWSTYGHGCEVGGDGIDGRVLGQIYELAWSENSFETLKIRCAGIEYKSNLFNSRIALTLKICQHVMVFVIDGPAGSGKSSTAKAVALNLGLTYLDSGAIYRAVTWLRLNTEADRFFDVLKSASFHFSNRNGVFQVALNSMDVTPLLRTPEIDANVSAVSADPEIRKMVNELLRAFTADGYFIADGRDLGTVVFPDAPVKVFMIADLKTRAGRRFLDQRQQGISLNEIEAGLNTRDTIDSNRGEAPLKQAEDARLIDTSTLQFDQQVRIIEDWIRPHLVRDQ